MKYILQAIAIVVTCIASAQAQSTDKYAVGGRMVCALNDSGALNCATDNAFTRLQPPSNAPALTSIAAGDVHVCGLTETGSAFCWGMNTKGEAEPPTDQRFLQATLDSK